MLGLIIATQSSLQWKITMQERYLCWPPLVFSLAPQCQHFFHFRIATATPINHPLTKFIYITPSCWTIYRSFEIILYSRHGNCPLDWTSNPMFITNPLLLKTFSPVWIMFQKIILNDGYLMAWQELFLHTSIWASEEEHEFENFNKYAVFLISSGKNLISPLLVSRRKTFGKIH